MERCDNDTILYHSMAKCDNDCPNLFIINFTLYNFDCIHKVTRKHVSYKVKIRACKQCCAYKLIIKMTNH